MRPHTSELFVNHRRHPLTVAVKFLAPRVLPRRTKIVSVQWLSTAHRGVLAEIGHSPFQNGPLLDFKKEFHGTGGLGTYIRIVPERDRSGTAPGGDGPSFSPRRWGRFFFAVEAGLLTR